MLPLPERHATAEKDHRNQGLFFSKFTDVWQPEDGNGLGADKDTWFRHFNGKIFAAEAYAKRIAALVETQGKVETFETTGPFVTGMGLPHAVENGFLWHHTLGVPYLPGSSVKGMVRAWVEHWLGDDTTARRLFGGTSDDPGVGSIIFHDAIPVANARLYVEIITAHTGDWRITDTPESSPPADWVSPNPIKFLAIAEGAQFQFALSARGNTEKGDIDLAFDYLKQALEWIGAGAKTGIGFGRFETPVAIQKRQIAQRQAAQEAVENWVPSVGETVLWQDAGENVVITRIDGDTACFHFEDDEDDIENAPVSDLRRL